jgi:hypothetical protein
MAVPADDDVVVRHDPERAATSMIERVISMSARDGVGSREGWLCTKLLGKLSLDLICF